VPTASDPAAPAHLSALFTDDGLLTGAELGVMRPADFTLLALVTVSLCVGRQPLMLDGSDLMFRIVP
jgi:hypothetical protein